jgi:Fe-S cluster assembly iron-binding protein IscA
MALDEPQENDEVIKDNGITYLIDKELLDQAKPINVDFVAACGSSCGTSCG